MLKSEGQINLTLPFDMPGIRFSNLKFAVWHPQPISNQPVQGSLYWLQGTVKYGTLDLTGQIYLLGSTPVLVKVELLDLLSIETLLEQSIPGSTSWSKNLINITFKKGSTIYYYNQKKGSESLFVSDFKIITTGQDGKDTIQPGDKPAKPEYKPVYTKGFNIYAEIDLTLFETISFVGNFGIISEAKPNDQLNGVSASIQLKNPIDIYVLQISAAIGDGNGGPKFEISKSNNDYAIRLKCGLKFFKTDFSTNTEVEITKDCRATNPNNSTLITGKLTTQERFEVFNNEPVSLKFSYSQCSGFRIENWPKFSLAKNIIDFVKTLQELASEAGGPCGKLGDFIVDQAYKTKFTISPSFSTKTDGLYFVLNGTYTLSVLANDFLVADFPNAIEFLLPNSLSFDKLPEQIANSLAAASRLFVQALLKNKEAIAKFLVIIGGKKATQYVNDLLCNGLVDAAVVSAVEAGGSALEAVGGITAGVDAIEGAIAGALLHHSHPNDDGDDSGRGKPKHDGGNSGDNGNTVHNPIAPNALTLRYENNQILANWMPVTYAAGFRVTWVDSSGKSLHQELLPNTQRTISFRLDESNTDLSYTIRVSATRGDYFSPEAVATIDRWQTPTNLQLSVLKDSQKIQVNWTGHETNSEQSYAIQLIQNSTLITSTQATHSPIEFDAVSLSSGQYQVVITSTGSTNRLPSLPSPPSKTVYLLAPPEDVLLSFNSDTQSLSVTWNSVEFATGYRIRILNESSDLEGVNTSLPATNSEPVSNNKFSISLDYFSNPGVYYAQIFAVGNEVSFDSSITQSTDTVTRLEALQDLRQSVNKAKKQLILDWQRLEGATQYEVESGEQSEEELLFSAVLDQPISVAESPQIRIDLAPYLKPQGLTLIMRVRSRGTSNILPGNFLTASNPVVQIAAPVNVTMIWLQETGVINVTWQGNEQAVQYQIKILEVATQSVAISRIVGSSHSQLTIQESKFSSPPSGTYQLKIQALANKHNFDSMVATGNQVEIIRLSPPKLNSLVLANENQLVATIAEPVRFAEGYEAQLVVDGSPVEPVIRMQPRKGTNANYQASFTVDEMTNGANFQIQARAIKLNNSSSDWAISDHISRLASPKLQPLILGKNTITVRLADIVEGANSYQAQFVFEGRPIEQPITMAQSAIVPSVLEAQLSNDYVYGSVVAFSRTVQVRVKALGIDYLHSQWTTSTLITNSKAIDPNSNSHIIRFNYFNLDANQPGFFMIESGPIALGDDFRLVDSAVFDSRNKNVKLSMLEYGVHNGNYLPVKLITKTLLTEVGKYTAWVYNTHPRFYTEKQTAFISPKITSYDLQCSIVINNHKSMLLFQGIYNCQDLGDLVDNLSKFIVPQGFQVILYENPGWTGRTRNFTQDTIWVSNGFNTRNCSIKVLWTEEEISPI